VRSNLGWPAWIGVVADNLEAQAAFYRDVLGFRQSDVGEDWVQFEFGGRTFEILGRSSLPQYDKRRVQLGFEVDDIELARSELLAAGVEAVTGIEGGGDGGSRWAYFRDPEGNVFEITQRQRRRA
jgi:predicted enzyme related to lactoylglutathione lyase